MILTLIDSTLARKTGIILLLILSVIKLYAQEEDLPKDTSEYDTELSMGSVLKIEETDLNKGFITSPFELVLGKTPGTLINTQQGQVSSELSFITRGVSSFVSDGSPLVILDGIPYYFGIPPIHPNDIESITIARDNVAAFKYAGKPSHGIVVIKTKKADDKAIQINYSGRIGYSALVEKYNVLNADDYRKIIAHFYANSPATISSLGNATSDWQDLIFDNSTSTDNTIRISGDKELPFRLSYAKTNQNGMLIETGMKREILDAAISPTLFDDHLKLDVNYRKLNQSIDYNPNDVIGAAIIYDPTRDPYTDDGDLFEFESALSPKNPLGIIKHFDGKGELSNDYLTTGFRYNLHFLPSVSVNGTYHSRTINQDNYTKSYNYNSQSSIHSTNENIEKTEFFDASIHYLQSFKYPDTCLKIEAGLLKNMREITTKSHILDDFDSRHFYSQSSVERHLASFYTQINYGFRSKYRLNLNLREDLSSSLAPDFKSKLSWAVAGIWDAKKEDFLIPVNNLSMLVFKASYGFNYSDLFTIGSSSTGIDPQITYEKQGFLSTSADFGLFDNRLTGSIEYYHNKGSQLFSSYYSPPGSIIRPSILTNAGILVSDGSMLTINYQPKTIGEFTWQIGTNITYNRNHIKSLFEDIPGLIIQYGSITGDVGQTIKALKDGIPLNSFFMYEQLYDNDGSPVEGQYFDQNNDDLINETDLKVQHHSDPAIFIGISSFLNYKEWMLSFSGRANIGNYVYNNVESTQYLSGLTNGFSFTNTTYDAIDRGFNAKQLKSNLFLENASFFRMDFITLSKKFIGMFGSKSDLEVFSSVQNAFVISGYTGPDPEIVDGIDSGIDSGIYLRPRIFTLGVNWSIF